ncbi:helix-turn-helix transcriptional regulator [uncultured Alsobacter sp.]|uniref:helix-turn-helix domain-containing protein n=1 Tax=uncultured Alsobacter sp. TaxID=1748258 RepID=UPI0025FF20F7|nr:helix-turn-helix transcriptional regulator [uncultured Alsobacter sp.]
MIDEQQLREWFIEAMKKSGISQSEMSRRLSAHLNRVFHVTYVNRIVMGQRQIGGDELLAIRDILSVALPSEQPSEVKPPEEEDELPEPASFLRLARSYAAAARYLEPHQAQLKPRYPMWYLASHAIELSLKAVCLAVGQNPRKYGHDIMKAARAVARLAHVEWTDDDLDRFHFMSSVASDHALRYVDTNYRVNFSDELVEWTFSVVDRCAKKLGKG